MVGEGGGRGEREPREHGVRLNKMALNSSLTEGALAGDYRVIKKLAEGGMGEVESIELGFVTALRSYVSWLMYACVHIRIMQRVPTF